MVISPMLAPSDNALLNWIANDRSYVHPEHLMSFASFTLMLGCVRYYCCLLPLLIPVTLVSIYLNWLGFKLYRHN